MSGTHHRIPAGGASAQQQGTQSAQIATTGGGFSLTEDWLAAAVGLLVIVIAWALFGSGGSIKWLAVAPAKWSSIGQAAQDFARHLPGYVALFITFALLFGVSVTLLRKRAGAFLTAILVVFVVSALILILGAWADAPKYNPKPPLVALALGLILSNVFTLPEWLAAVQRVEF
jgi:hypothetical protein